MWVHKTKFIKEARLGWLMTGPSLIVIGAIAVYPILYTMWLSLHAFNLKEPAAGKPFVGLANYWAFFTDPQALGGLWNTVIFTAVTVALEFLLGPGQAGIHGRV